MTARRDRCSVVEIDGEPVRVRSAATMNAADEQALRELVRAARTKFAAEGHGTAKSGWCLCNDHERCPGNGCTCPCHTYVVAEVTS